ncbi:Membrane protein involved in colicin uptake [Yersinia mollaretii ATCC 43969]|uniref:Membrane protein involved in colicin uptake n=2 Tax=Yersinia mollaretii TaxID=33060 RepID=A0ABP2EMP8_YERMW|nr:Membrane protein involved in colicin uptake [Yersinia mollaretii ATCC 43969]
MMVNITLKTVNSDIKPAMMPETFLSELTSKLANRNGGGLAENRASQIPNKITEEIIQAKAQHALEAPKRALAEKREDARVADARKAEAQLALVTENAAKAKAESDKVMAVLIFDKNGVPLPPQFPPMGDQTKLSPKPDNQAKEARKPVATAKQAMMQSGVMEELAQKLKRMNSHNSVVAENKTNKFTNKITEEIALVKAEYVLDAPKRVLAEKVEDARVVEGLKAEGKLALEAVNVAKVNAEADQLKASLVYDENKIPLAPPLPPTL